MLYIRDSVGWSRGLSYRVGHQDHSQLISIVQGEAAAASGRG